MTRRVSLLLAAVTALAVLAAGCSFFERDYTPGNLAIPAETDVPYGPARGCNVQSPGIDQDCGGSQELDIYRSDESGPNPVALFVHGGGFIGGDKGNGVNEYFQELLDGGWDILAVNYRFATESGENQWPIPFQDLNRAVRWVKANAEAQDWDADHIAAIGHSAGGNLVGLLATTANDPDMQPADLPPELEAVDASVESVIALNAVFDLNLYYQTMFGDTVEQYLGCASECPELVAIGSVQNHVDEDSAPMLALLGANDPIAPPEQGELMQAAYENAGIGDRFELIIVDDGLERFRSHEPDIRRFADDFLDFIDDPPGTDTSA